jgi:hypothetical protein
VHEPDPALHPQARLVYVDDLRALEPVLDLDFSRQRGAGALRNNPP